jgi:hypothetical protein
LQRLPPHRIQRAYEVSEIGLEEDPAPASFRSGDEAALRPAANLFGMHVEKSGGFIQAEGLHATVSSDANLTPDALLAISAKKSVRVSVGFEQKLR